MTHAESCVLEGQYLLSLPALRTTDDFDDSLVDSLGWGDIEILCGYCLDRTSDMPAGSCHNLGLGSEQRRYTEGELLASQRGAA